MFDDWERLDEWVTIYHEIMQRLDASKFYFFPREHLTALHEAVGDRMHLAVAIVNGDERGGLGGHAGASRASTNTAATSHPSKWNRPLRSNAETSCRLSS